MAMEPGYRLGAYEILSALGAGGMGEVYRARDSKLKRDVALKVLPDAFAADADRLARFEREAQLLASLSHPNIAVIHGIEEGRVTGSGGESRILRALVLELVEGPTLAERIGSGALPLEQALPIARQLCDALAAAHEHGIIHRDLKPANIKVRPDGTVKVLDFGLGKALEGELAATDSSSRATLLSPAMTRQGIVLGTAAYMSPEQARGHPADERSDIWAFGCVLFEMLVGKLTFYGPEVSDTVAAVLRDEPAWRELPAATPASVRRLLRRCLQKDARQRLADVRDARLELDDAAEPADAGTRARPPPWRERIAWTLAGLAIAAAAITLAMALRTTADSTPVTQLAIMPPEGAQFSLDRTSVAISRDGRQIAFVATGADGLARLWVRALESPTPRVLAGTENARAPFWSPDGRSIAFFADSSLKRVDSLGGSVQVLASADSVIATGGSWAEDDVILFGQGFGRPILKVGARGGATTPVTQNAENAVQGAPISVSNGRFLFAMLQGPTRATMLLGTLQSDAAPQPLFEAESTAVYSSGYLLYVGNSALLAQRFDPVTGALSGDPVPLLDEANAGLAFAASANGTLVYRRAASLTQFVWRDRDGRAVETASAPLDYGTWSLSRDDRRVAFDRVSQTGMDVWILDLQRQVPSRLTVRQSSNVPLWSPDGSRVVFAAVPDTGLDIYERASSGAGDDVPLAKLDAAPIMFPSDWSRDGQTVAYYRTIADQLDMFVMRPSAGAEPEVYLDGPFNESQGQFSPDGRWFAYVSDESGVQQVYVTAFPTPAGREQISIAGGSQPRWAPDGSEVFYVGPDRRLMAVALRLGETIAADRPRVLFTTSLNTAAMRQTYDVSADGMRFLLQEPVEGSSAPLIVVQNWPALLPP
jgi:Tol biopolymer transport system component